MSVVGVGLDLVNVESFGRQIEATGTSFLLETFTPVEMAGAAEVASSLGPAARTQHLAARLGAKEAFVKAWSMTRVGRVPALASVQWKEIEVRNDAWGRPILHLSGQTAEAVSRTLGEVSVTVSLSHDDSMAAAVVVLDQGHAR